MPRLNIRISWSHACMGMFLCVSPAVAQQVSTNLAVYEQLGTNCLGALAGDFDSLAVAAPAAMPYVTGALYTFWRSEGRIVFDSTLVRMDAALPVLSWRIERATVSYARARRKAVARTVNLDLRYTMTSSSGQILEHDVCHQYYDDIVQRDQLAILETAAYPETQAEAPAARWPRRYFEPIVLGAATALVAFLFFNLRSDRADS